jgi:CheY-like chemotaxis protein
MRKARETSDDVDVGERIRPTAIVVIAHRNVAEIRDLSELLQKSGLRVMMLSSSENALQLVASSRCDVLVIGEGLTAPSGAELCRTLREKLGPRRPWFVKVGDDAERSLGARPRDDRRATPEKAAFDGSTFDVHAPSIAELASTVVGAVHARRASIAAKGST